MLLTSNTLVGDLGHPEFQSSIHCLLDGLYLMWTLFVKFNLFKRKRKEHDTCGENTAYKYRADDDEWQD